MEKMTPEMVSTMSSLQADEGDIAYYHSGVVMVCNREADSNNIAVERVEPISPRQLIRSVLAYLIVLNLEYGIDYVSFREDRRWRILDRYKTVRDGRTSYARLSENIAQLAWEIQWTTD